MKFTTLIAALAATSAMTVASAQTGTDGCTTPDAIAGQASFPFDTSLATTGVEGQTEPACYFFASSIIDNDVWFSWTADATGTAAVATCTSTVDTKIAVYGSAGCPIAGSAIACNDDACGLQTTVVFPVTSGTAYVLQVGSFPGAGGGTGNLDISIAGAVTNDDCAAPTVIAGQGSFPYNNLAASTGVEGQTEVLCYAFGSSAIDNDVWFSWTSDFTGTAAVSTCTSAQDTKIAAYPAGGCPTAGTALACNDDTCALQSQATFAVTNGTSYMLQVGNFPGAAGGASQLDISNFTATAGDDCASPTAIAGQGSFPYDNTSATTGLEGQNEALCYSFGTSGIAQDIWVNWTANATGLATISTCNSTQDTRLAAYPTGGCPTSGTSIACNDDTCGLQSEITLNAVAGTTYLLQIGNFPGTTGGISSLDILISGPAEPGTPFCFCNSGNDPCGNGGAAGNGCANSSFLVGANLTGQGVAQVGADSLVLVGSGLRVSQPGLYFQGNNAVAGGAGVIFGDGIRCAGQSVIRLGVVVADASGDSDTSGLPIQISVKGGVTAGDLKHYQLWYRDPGVGSPCGTEFNLTNGYSIQW